MLRRHKVVDYLNATVKVLDLRVRMEIDVRETGNMNASGPVPSLTGG